MKSKDFILFLLCFVSILVSSCGESSLLQGFRQPPDSTKPWVYWYWISDNISRQGLTRDLEAMAAVGIGEAFIGNIFLENTQRGSVKALTPEWWNMVEHAIREGDRLGVKIGLFNCPGWSQSGGPWIKPEQSMRYVTYTEKRVHGPVHFHETLPAASDHFQDIAVLAFPAPKADDDQLLDHSPRISCSSSLAGAEKWADADHLTSAPFPLQEGKIPDSFSIEISLPHAIEARSLALYPGEYRWKALCDFQIMGSDLAWHAIKQFNFDRSNASVNVGPMTQGAVVESFHVQSGDRFRLQFSKIKGKPGLAEIRLSAAARVERFIEKQLGKMHPTPQPFWDTYLWPQPPEPESKDLVVAIDKVRNISDCLSSNGTVQWEVPEGEWVILRMGMTPTGTKNSPASPEAQGLEVDKMSRTAAEYHFNAFIGEILRRLPLDQRKALSHVVADSYEMGSQNWTDGLREDFQQRYGYDPLTWLPVLSGRIIGSADQSERFLWDLRRMVADRIAQDYVGGLAEISHRAGLKLWLENYGHWGFPAEFLQYGGQADHISGEFWATGDLGSIELRAASSASHIYGMPVTSAEAFTGGPHFVSHPWSLKKRGDWAYCDGINHFVLHVYIHQPWDDRKPGMNAWFGTEFNRHNTWFQQSKTWIDYLRRCHFMLQQGTHVADVAYYIGEDTPKMTGICKPALPRGFDFDYINAEVILNRLQVKNNRFILPDGSSFSVLVLPDLSSMRPQVLKKIKELVESGGIVLGNPPIRSPSLQHYPESDRQIVELAAALWKGCDGTIQRRAASGKGLVFRNLDLETIFKDLEITADVSIPDAQPILWTHRSSSEAEIYFLTNQSEKKIFIEPLFRVQDRQPELWNPETGEIVTTARCAKAAHGMRVSLSLDPRGAVLVVFRNELGDHPTIVKVAKDYRSSDLTVRILDQASLQADVDTSGTWQLHFSDGKARTIEVKEVPHHLALTGSWQVQFPSLQSAPVQTVLFDSLVSWTDHPDPTIRYFSGTAHYQKTLDLDSTSLSKDDPLYLDLGRVGVIASVKINDTPLAVLWKPPFVVDVGRSLRAGVNTLDISVTNVWKNRLIGAARFPHGYPFASGSHSSALSLEPFLAYDIQVRPDEELIPSGLLGPVWLKQRIGVTIGDF